jgi:hypothetical protein
MPKQEFMNMQQVRQAMDKGKPKRGKFGTVVCKKDKPTMDGYVFDSKGEMRRYEFLKLEQSLGEIDLLEVHPNPAFPLIVNGVKISHYSPDFRYVQDGVLVIEDFKSGPTRTRDYVMRRKLMLACHGITIRESGR